MVTIIRNNQNFGPYTIDVLKKYVEEGKILTCDKAQMQHTSEITTVKDILKSNHISINRQNNGTIIQQVLTIGKDLLIPSFEFIKKDLFKDKRLIYLATIGLAPAFLIRFTFQSIVTFYAIALYFSVLWAVFFFSLFKTYQVEIKKTIIIFFLSQLTALILVNLQSFPPFSILYSFTDSSNFILQVFGYTLGVGVLEEFIKAVPLYFILFKAREPMIPQTIVLYGLISGIGFGVLEGVIYQTGENTELEYNNAFFMNVARLTSLPFLHAIWCGISGYFLSFSQLFPLNRKGLILLSISVPAILHGLYDVFTWNLIGLGITIFSVLLLVFYIKKCLDYQSKLN
jgi:protease PrsW